MLLKLDVNWLIITDIHEVEWSPPLPNQFQVGRILRIVKSVELAIVDAEAVGPKM